MQIRTYEAADLDAVVSLWRACDLLRPWNDPQADIALCARTAVLGAFMNVKINASGLEDRDFVREVLARGESLQAEAIALETAIRELVEAKI